LENASSQDTISVWKLCIACLKDEVLVFLGEWLLVTSSHAPSGGILKTTLVVIRFSMALTCIVLTATPGPVHAWQTSDYYDEYQNPQRPDPAIQIIDGIFKTLQQLDQPPPRPPRPPYPQPYPNQYYVPPRPPVQPAPPPPKLVEPLKNKVAPQPTQPLKNASPLALVEKCDAKLIRDLQAQVDSVVLDATVGVQEQINLRKPPVESLVAAVGGGKTLSEQQLMLDRARMGDVGFLVLATAGDNSAEAEQLRQYAYAVQSLKEVEAAARQGTLNNPMRRQLVDALFTGGFIASTAPVMPLFNMFDMANGVAGIVSNSQPNAPIGPLSTLLFVGNMPASQVLFLGGGAALVGTGGESEGVILTSGSLGQAVGMNSAAGSPVPDDDNDPLLAGTIIKNTGPSEVNFVVGSKRASLDPDQAKIYTVSEGDMIEFYKSEDAKKTRYKLEDACYEFRQSASEWGLFKVSYSITIDNSENAADFRFVAVNKQSLVKAGKKETIQSSHPIVVRFDNGNDEVKQKRLSKGTFKVGMNSKGHLDLYAEEDVQPPAPAQEVIQNESINLFGNWTQAGAIVSTPFQQTPPPQSSGNSPQLFK
jgi:hypothetical protein